MIKKPRQIPNALLTSLIILLAFSLSSCGGGGSGGGGDGDDEENGGNTSKPPLEVIDLGTYNVPADDNFTQFIDIPVDPRATSFSLVASKPAGLSGSPWFGELLSPSGFGLITGDWSDFNPIRGGQSTYPAQCVLIPNSQRYGFETGTHRLSLAYTASNTSLRADINLKLILSRRSDLSHGIIDLNFFFTSLEGIDASGAPWNTNFQAALGYMSDVLSRAGLSFGNVGYIDLPAEAAERLAVIDYDTDNDEDGKSDELEDLFSQSSILPADSTALNFFLIREYTNEGIAGVAAGIPGAFFFSGTPMSGVSVAMGSINDEPEKGIRFIGETIAHEGLHYLGLYHLSERGRWEDWPQEHDLSDDTPECPVDSEDIDADGIVSAAECWTLGMTNNMFWSGSAVRQAEITPGQAWIVQRNPIVRDGTGVTVGTMPEPVPRDSDGAVIYEEEEPNETGGQELGVPVTAEGEAAWWDSSELSEPEDEDGLEDIFTVLVRGGRTVTFDLTPAEPVSPDADLDIYLISSDGEFVAQSTSEDSYESITYTPDESGDLFLAVSAWDGSSGYSLKIR